MSLHDKKTLSTTAANVLSRTNGTPEPEDILAAYTNEGEALYTPEGGLTPIDPHHNIGRHIKDFA